MSESSFRLLNHTRRAIRLKMLVSIRSLSYYFYELSLHTKLYLHKTSKKGCQFYIGQIFPLYLHGQRVRASRKISQPADCFFFKNSTPQVHNLFDILQAASWKKVTFVYRLPRSYQNILPNIRTYYESFVVRMAANCENFSVSRQFFDGRLSKTEKLGGCEITLPNKFHFLGKYWNELMCFRQYFKR